jgi:penicillin-binding protein 2
MRALLVVLFAGIFLRLVQLQVVEGARNRKLADENRIRVIRRPAARGNILDRKGRVLAGSGLAFSVCVVPEELGVAGSEEPVAVLAGLLGLQEREVREKLAGYRASGGEPVVIWREASPEVVARLEEEAVYLSGVSTIAFAVRHYPYGSLAAHSIGYVREVSPEDLAGNADYRLGDLIGKAGVEKVADDILRGIDGGDQIEVDARGKRVRTLGTVAPRPGQDVRLTLDLEVQLAAEEALGDRTGAVVAMDPESGEILALVSHPGYDPNLFAGPVTPVQWKRLTGPGRPQHNRAISSSYPPGSVFKPVTAAAALEAGVCDEQSRFYCSGVYRLGRWKLRCWRLGGHGAIDFIEGFAQSCNVMFAGLGRRVGSEKLHQMATRFGLGRKSGIDLPQEVNGLVPSASWKKRERHQPWYPGDTCQMAIGQGDCLTTPLQVAREFAVLANGGYLVRPHVIARVGKKRAESDRAERRSLGLRPETIAALRAGAESVLAAGGTAHRIASDKYRIAGKTGTAQNPGGASHAWFAGYAPAEEPRLVVAVVVEHGEHGSTVAAPIARHVLDAALLSSEERRPWPGGTAKRARGAAGGGAREAAGGVVREAPEVGGLTAEAGAAAGAAEVRDTGAEARAGGDE